MAAEAGKNPPTPTEADLAFFVPEDRLHGYGIAFPGHIRYWRKQRERAAERVEPAREGMANRVLAWLTLDEANPLGLRNPTYYIGGGTADEKITPSIAEGYRRYMLGGLAVSRFVRSSLVMDLGDEIADSIGTGELEIVTDMSVDHLHPDEWPHEPRFHVAFGPKTKGEIVRGDTWSNPSPNLLLCKRYPADITLEMIGQLAEKGFALDPERAITFMPHLIAEHSPQFRPKQ